MAYSMLDFVPQNVVTALMIERLVTENVFTGLIGVSTPATLGRGASYNIPGVFAPTIRQYVSSADLVIETPSSIKSTIVVNKENYYDFYADIITASEVAYDILPAYVQAGADGLSRQIDVDIAKILVSSACNTVSGGTIDASNVLTWFADCRKVFDTKNVPSQGRWLVVPPAITSALLRANVTVNQAGAPLAQSQVGNVFGIDVYASNNLVADTSASFVAVGGVKSSAHMVMTLTDVDSGKSEKQPKTWNRGFAIYGVGLLDPNSVINSSINK